MIVCDRCGRENQDHYKFCLGCGAELPRDAAKKPKEVRVPTPPGGVPAMKVAEDGASAEVAAPPSPPVAKDVAETALDPSCPQCGTSNPSNFQFCGACGFNLASPPAAGSPPSPPVAAAAPVAAAPAQVTAAFEGSSEPLGKLVIIRPDGTEGDSIPIRDGVTIGRETGSSLASDAYLSPKHATFRRGTSGDLTIHDESSLNGVYWRLAPDTPYELVDGAIFRIGQEIIRFETLPSARAERGVDLMGSPNEGFLGRISLIVGLDTSGNSFCIPKEGMHLGRERGDIIFPDDGYVSGLHCRVYGENGKVFITDAGSSNGTFIRVNGQYSISDGALILMGQQLFRLESSGR